MKGKITYFTLFGLLGGFVFFLLLNFIEHQFLSVNRAQVYYEVQADSTDEFEVFYDVGGGWQPDQKVSKVGLGKASPQTFRFPALHTKHLRRVRLDFGRHNQHIQLRKAFISSSFDTLDLLANQNLVYANCFSIETFENSTFSGSTTCSDPHLVFNCDLSPLQLGRYTKTDQVIIGGFSLLYGLLLILFVRKRPGFAQLAKMRTSTLIFAAGFIGIISIHWTFSATGIGGVNFALEKRAPIAKPDLNSENFIADFSAWFEDHLVIRQELTQLKSLRDYHWFDKSALPEKAILGKNQELYPSSEYLLDDFVGSMQLEEVQLLSMRINLLEKINYLKAQGKDYYLFFAPNKQTIYPNDLPAKYRLKHDPAKTMLSQAMNYLMQDTLIAQHLVDLRPVLQTQAQQQNQRIYCKNDLHWNGHGAFYGYEALFNFMAQRHPSLYPLKKTDFIVEQEQDDQGDLARVLIMHQQAPRTRFHFTTDQRPAFDMETIHGKYTYPMYHTRNKQSQAPKAVIFRDSFCQDMIQFMSLHFSEARYIWDQAFNLDVLRENDPDIVIQEITEMFIYDLLQVNPKGVRSA